MTPQERRAANQRGVEAAAREHVRLGTTLTSRVDVFDIIQGAGIWLMFQPLGIYGLYKRIRAEPVDTSGILINAKHPPSLQRFTAAHEYGHHVLEHDESVDGEEELGLTRQAQVDSVIEVEAQAFAANFLMPAQLVYTVLRQMSLPRTNATLSGRQAYLISLELGASYTATLTQLRTLDVITSATWNRLLDEKPIDAKAAIIGERPQDSRADTWFLEARQTGRTVYPRVKDELVLDLPEMPSTGYLWNLPDDEILTPDDDNPNAAFLELARDEFIVPPEEEVPRMGGGGTRHFVLRVLHSGRRRLVVAKHRPWQNASQSKETFELNLEIAPSPTGGTDSGLSVRQQSLLVA